MSKRPLLAVANGALPAPLFRRLARAVRALGTEGLRATYRTTFWYGLGPPAAIPEEAIQALRPRLPRRGAGIAGVEWWLSRMRTSDVGVDFHRDRDEARFARTGAEVHPAFTAILFLNRCRGGLLAVTDAEANDANPARAPDDLASLDLVRPWPNRLAVFRGGATHGVLDANGELPHRRLVTFQGAGAPPPRRQSRRGPLPAMKRVLMPLRLALVVNGWPRRPERVPSFARAGRYRSLALPATGGGSSPTRRSA